MLIQEPVFACLGNMLLGLWEDLGDSKLPGLVSTVTGAIDAAQQAPLLKDVLNINLEGIECRDEYDT